MCAMDKQFEYLGVHFNISVILNYETERCIDGKTYHHITVNDMGPSNYYMTEKVIDEDLEAVVNNMTIAAKQWVDSRQSPPKHQLLHDLGFK